MKKYLLALLLLLTTVSLSGCVESLPDNCEKDGEYTHCSVQWLQYFDTAISLDVYFNDTPTENTVTTLLDTIETTLQDIHKQSDKYNTYEGYTNIKTINDNPTETHVIDDTLYEIIEKSLSYQSTVNQLFNIALNPVLVHWHDYREACNIYEDDVNCVLPLDTDLITSNLYTNPSDISLNEATNEITLKENMSLDLGGIAKGYATEKVKTILSDYDLRGYLFNNGTSNLSIGGLHPTRNTGDFIIGITDPVNIYSTFINVHVKDGVEVITSGDYQQYGITNGERYHHIINPLTLYPSRTMHSITLITDDACYGDVLSTALFSMTVEDALAFVNNLDDTEAVIYTLDGEIIYSDHFSQYLD